MSEYKRTPVQAIRVRLFCECGGEMSPTGEMLTTSPPWFPHRCPYCNKCQNERHKHPYVTFEEV